MTRNHCLSIAASAVLAMAALPAQTTSLSGTFTRGGKNYAYAWDGKEVVLKLDNVEVAKEAWSEDGACHVADGTGQVVLTLTQFGNGMLSVQVTPAMPVRASLGVTVEPPSEALAEHLGIDPDTAVLVRAVTDGSAAAKGGLKRSDLIIALDGQRKVDQASLTRLLGAKKPGDRLDLLVLRKGAELPLTVTLGQEEMAAFPGPFSSFDSARAGVFATDPLVWHSGTWRPDLSHDWGKAFDRWRSSEGGWPRSASDKAVELADVDKHLSEISAALERLSDAMSATKGAAKADPADTAEKPEKPAKKSIR